jgi:hypothetical protein
MQGQRYEQEAEMRIQTHETMNTQAYGETHDTYLVSASLIAADCQSVKETNP